MNTSILGRCSMNSIVFGVLAALVATVASPLAVGQLRVGIAIPTDSDSYWKLEEFSIGARLAAERLQSDGVDIEIVPFSGDFSHQSDLERLIQDAQDQDVDAIVGGADPRSAHIIRNARQFWDTPTVVITPPEFEDYTSVQGRNDHVLDLGISKSEIHRQVLRAWREQFNLESISVVYNTDYRQPREFGSLAISEIADAFGSHTVEADVMWSDTDRAESEDRFYTMIHGEPDGIVLAGPSWDVERWMEIINRSRFDTFVYIAPPISGLSELSTIAEQSRVPIFTGSQYWTNPMNETEAGLTRDTIRELEWSEDGMASPLALRVYDALAIIAQAARDNGLGSGETASFSWGNLSSVNGIKGVLERYGDRQVLSPPVELLRVDSSDHMQFISVTP